MAGKSRPMLRSPKVTRRRRSSPVAEPVVRAGKSGPVTQAVKRAAASSHPTRCNLRAARCRIKAAPAPRTARPAVPAAGPAPRRAVPVRPTGGRHTRRRHRAPPPAGPRALQQGIDPVEGRCTVEHDAQLPLCRAGLQPRVRRGMEARCGQPQAPAQQHRPQQRQYRQGQTGRGTEGPDPARRPAPARPERFPARFGSPPVEDPGQLGVGLPGREAGPRCILQALGELGQPFHFAPAGGAAL